MILYVVAISILTKYCAEFGYDSFLGTMQAKPRCVGGAKSNAHHWLVKHDHMDVLINQGCVFMQNCASFGTRLQVERGSLWLDVFRASL